jgi:hypothetical protein
MDETTHGFSRKVLDRAFTIELSDVDLSRWGAQATPMPNQGAGQEWPASAWQPRAISLASLEAPTSAEKDRIEQAVRVLSQANALLVPAQLQVGYRTRDEVALFLIHAAEVEDMFSTREGERVDPTDLALQMKVLPRLVGGSSGVRRAVEGLLSWSWGDNTKPSEEAAQTCAEEWERLGRVQSIPGARFPRTAARLCLMWERLRLDGFTSFWL